MKFEPLLKAAPFSGARVKPFDGTRQYLSTGDLQDDSLSFVEVTFKDKPSRADITVREGDVLFARMKGTKKVLRVTQELAGTIVSTGFAVLRPDEDCDPAYLATYLSTDCFERQKEKYCSGAIQPAITNGGIEKLQIPLPPVNDQIRIAHLLGKVEGLIAQRKQHLQQIDDLLKSVFLEMFGDPVRNGRGWPTEPLGTLATIERGRFSPRPRNDPRYYGGNYPFIQTGDISRSKGRLREYTQTLNELGTKVSKEFGIDTIVIAIVGATIGETAILEIPTYAPDSVIGITPRSADSRDSVFIEYVLRFWKPVLRARAPDAARANINIETLRPLQIIVPPERHKFSELMRKLEGLGTSVQKSLTDLETLFGALSQKAFKGELDLTRVLLPAFPAEGEQNVAVAPLPPQAVEPAIHLPDTDILPAALEIPEMRGHLLTQWLEAYRVQLGNATFSVDRFMAAAQTRLAELHPDIDFELGAADYEHTKQWVFEALRTGKLAQAMDDAGNRIQIKTAQA
jgi:type I restriction enzyme S subunit